MPFKNQMDLHIHTDNSDDGYHSVMLMAEYAVRTGMRAMAVTDHCECNRYRSDSFDRSIRQSYFQARKAAAVFSGRLIVLAGMELGQPMQDLDAAEDALAANEYDFVIGSLHNVSGKQDFWKLDYEAEDAAALFTRYLNEVLEMVNWGQFDTLAHLTYPLRYIVGEHHIALDPHSYSKQIDAILSLLAEKNLALEINTSGYRQPYGKPLPELWVVRRFYELGGKKITIGSDAHKCKDVGSNISDGMEMAVAAGFKTISLFQKREAIEIPIE